LLCNVLAAGTGSQAMRSKIVVCGATGHQGRAVVRHLLASGRWDVTAVSRAPANDAAAALARTGAEVVSGDLLDPTSLKNAFKGAYGVFGVTQPWSPDYRTADVASEIRQGKNIVDAAVAAGVNHLVFSTALRPESGLSGMPHVDSKIEIEGYARAATVTNDHRAARAVHGQCRVALLPGEAGARPWLCGCGCEGAVHCVRRYRSSGSCGLRASP